MCIARELHAGASANQRRRTAHKKPASWTHLTWCGKDLWGSYWTGALRAQELERMITSCLPVAQHTASRSVLNTGPTLVFPREKRLRNDLRSRFIKCGRNPPSLEARAFRWMGMFLAKWSRALSLHLKATVTAACSASTMLSNCCWSGALPAFARILHARNAFSFFCGAARKLKFNDDTEWHPRITTRAEIRKSHANISGTECLGKDAVVSYAAIWTGFQCP
ncbi:hypothetical protein B0T24DRAFT_251787 [Lasiosphaeria ovina]|uniref:Uncharacterized protein n=1 Tax=Lasiosphaeria ovina TaxID=92902 RepID=A0AAE0KC22_9PEZI|nr:hypothetical protein B0T24DRAFT_251787 [Lasiosphaeria ovina]